MSVYVLLPYSKNIVKLAPLLQRAAAQTAAAAAAARS
jgi:hypothetical protein